MVSMCMKGAMSEWMNEWMAMGCSASAYFVITTLKNLSRDGRTVIASIHQPSSEVFALFDNLFLLSGGHTIFFGAAGLAHEVSSIYTSISSPLLMCLNSGTDGWVLLCGGWAAFCSLGVSMPTPPQSFWPFPSGCELRFWQSEENNQGIFQTQGK